MVFLIIQLCSDSLFFIQYLKALFQPFLIPPLIPSHITLFLSSRVTADGDCSHKIKRLLLLERRAMTNLAYLKTETSLCHQSPSSQSCAVSSSHVWIWELDHKEGWVPKNRCFWIVVWWRKPLRVPWTARRSNQSILKVINSEYSLEGLVLKSKLQSFGHLMWGTNSLEKTMVLGKTEGKRRGQQRMS